MSYFAFAPTGTITIYNNVTPPEGWLFCDGTAVSRSFYASLWSAIGTSWGSGDGVSTFNIPNLQGVLLRGRDGGANRDTKRSDRKAIATGGATGDNVGSYQIFSILDHTHAISNSLPTTNISHLHTASDATVSHSHSFIFGEGGGHTHDVAMLYPSQIGAFLGSRDDNVIDQFPVPYTVVANNYSWEVAHYAFTNTGYPSHYHGITSNPDSPNDTHRHSLTVTTLNRGTTDSRPINVAAAYIIKF